MLTGCVFLQTTKPSESQASHYLVFAMGVVFAAVVLGITVTALHLNSTIRAAPVIAVSLVVTVVYCARQHILWLFHFVFLEDAARRAVVGGWTLLLTISLPLMLLLARSHRCSNIILRKGYHVLAVALFLPALLRQPQLLGVALAVAFAVLVAVEVVRCGTIPGVSDRVQAFMSSFVDSRDCGVVFVTHFTLLLGLALPVWLSNAMNDSSPALVVNTLWPGALAGIVATGVGDAAASVVGSSCGRICVAPGSQKTVEGTVAGGVAMVVAWVGMVHAHWIPPSSVLVGGGAAVRDRGGWAMLVGASVLSSVLEASTDQLDNMFIPLHYFALICCLLN